MFPFLEVNVGKIAENIKTTFDICQKNGVGFSLVTKLLSGNADIIKPIVEAGVDSICDSRIENMRAMYFSGIQCSKILIREPMHCEANDVVKYCDISFNCEMSTLKLLEIAAKAQNKTHGIILTAEIGDLREGTFLDKLVELSCFVKQSDSLKLLGIATNVGDYGSVVPTVENMDEFANIACQVEEKAGVRFDIVSGGSSNAIPLLLDGKLNKKINHLRIGETIFIGNIPCFEMPAENFHTNAFLLHSQIVEVQEKPSVPYGKRAEFDGLGNTSAQFVDRGVRKRALVALGRQDVACANLVATDDKVEILGDSSDYTILDIDESATPYKVGDEICFKLSYTGVLQAMTSGYVKKMLENVDKL